MVARRVASKPRLVINEHRKATLRERLRTGCQWKFLPSEWPKWQRATVHSYFAKWSKPDETGIRVLERALQTPGWRGPHETGALPEPGDQLVAQSTYTEKL